MPMAYIPPVMTNPDLLPLGVAWTQTCGMKFHGTNAAGHPVTRTCGLRTQGGIDGLTAHIRTVHQAVA